MQSQKSNNVAWVFLQNWHSTIWLLFKVTRNPNNTKLQTLEAITIAGEVKQRERFQPIIQGDVAVLFYCLGTGGEVI